MTHLNDEQLETLLDAPDAPGAEHLGECDACRQRLAEMLAVRDRLRSAMQSVRAPESLTERLRAAARQRHAGAARPVAPAAASRPVTILRGVWPAMLAAAALLLVMLPAVIYFAAPAPVTAAQQLVDIHRGNLATERVYTAADTPEELADYFREHLDFSPALPELNHGMKLRGCCLVHFQSEIVGSYVVDTPAGIVSVVAVTQKANTLGLNVHVRRDGRIYFTGEADDCSLAAVRLGEYTYTAIGEVPAGELIELLRLLARPKPGD